MKLKWKQVRTYRHTAEFISSAPGNAKYLLEIFNNQNNFWHLSIELELHDEPECLIMSKMIELGQKYSATAKAEAEKMLAEWFGYMAKDDEKFKALEDVK